MSSEKTHARLAPVRRQFDDEVKPSAPRFVLVYIRV
jgi:hypothetical protein